VPDLKMVRLQAEKKRQARPWPKVFLMDFQIAICIAASPTALDTTSEATWLSPKKTQAILEMFPCIAMQKRPVEQP
jgi:hypothetical protein